MMLPNTALNLRESKRNQLKDFVSVAGPLGVSHFMILTATDSSSYMRIAKAPRVRPRRRQPTAAACLVTQRCICCTVSLRRAPASSQPVDREQVDKAAATQPLRLDPLFTPSPRAPR